MHEIRFYQGKELKKVIGRVTNVRNQKAILVENNYGGIKIKVGDIAEVKKKMKDGIYKRIDIESRWLSGF